MAESTQQVVTLLPIDLIASLDALAREYKSLRSALIREACRAYVDAANDSHNRPRSEAQGSSE
jgi:metal-responsive CopG/Arc/MetJ family transcriptional regulator